MYVYGVVYAESDLGLSSVTISPSTGIVFCCGMGFDESTGNCSTHTRQMGQSPFNLPASAVIYDRTTGATIPAAVPGQSFCAAATTKVASTAKRDVTIALGTGLPLLTATLAALGLFRRERRRRLTLANSPAGSGLQNPTTVLVSLGTNKVYEFEGTPAVKELDASYIPELGGSGFEVI